MINSIHCEKNPEKHTLAGRTSPLSPHKEVPPPPPPGLLCPHKVISRQPNFEGEIIEENNFSGTTFDMP